MGMLWELTSLLEGTSLSCCSLSFFLYCLWQLTLFFCGTHWLEQTQDIQYRNLLLAELAYPSFIRILLWILANVEFIDLAIFVFPTFILNCWLMLPNFLASYESARRIRVAVIHGMARMAAMMASTYKAYLGVGLGPLSVGISCWLQMLKLNSGIEIKKQLNFFPWKIMIAWLFDMAFQFLTKLRIPHPGRVGGRFFIDLAMPLMLSWVLGGNRLDVKNPISLCLAAFMWELLLLPSPDIYFS